MPAGPVFPLVPLPTPPVPEPPTPVPKPTRALINPAAWAYRITSVFGDPRDYGGHEGIDLAPTGKTGPYPVVAAAAGEVIDAGWDTTGYGYFVRLAHAAGVETLYGHLAETPPVKKGDKVVQGQLIGNAGNTGNSSGTHLHFSVLADGEYLDPIKSMYDATYAVIQDAVAQASDLARQLAVDDPCSGYADDMAQWVICRGGHGLPDDADTYMRTFEQFRGLGETDQLALRDATRAGLAAQSEGSTIKNATNSIIDGIKNWVLGGVTWPFRAMINALQLSETPLTTGAQTVAWLQAPENQRLYIASQVALLLVVVLLILAAAMFLRPSAETIVKTVTPIAEAAL